jgi:anti-sigma factor RsiW
MAAAADRNAESSKPSRRDLAELSALADGTLDATRRAAVQARGAGSVELSELYERQRRAVDLVRRSLAEVRVPLAVGTP